MGEINYFMIIDSFFFLVVTISIIKLVVYISNLLIVKDYLKNKKELVGAPASILMLIPVISEQKIIIQTIEHFIRLKHADINIYIVIAGTSREKFGKNSLSTRQVVEQWIHDHETDLSTNIKGIFFSEIFEQDGDRATQLNYAVRYFENKYPDEKIDYIGVYDADSLPSLYTLLEVTKIFTENPDTAACQQPVSFIKSANRMALEEKNPILVANAIYQTTWTMIRELPSWIKYGNSCVDDIFKENIYLIGHGEFLRKSIYNQFKFPEFEITDGIQLGYRLGMSNKKIMPLREFCDDDVPQSIGQLIQQHKRWFGGCMNIYDAYYWSKFHFNVDAFWQMLDGYWSQFCWCYASLIMWIAFLSSAFLGSVFFFAILGIVIIYSYILPVLAHCILNDNIDVRIIDWLVLPFAIALKGIGPNLYVFNKIFNKNIKYVKVER